VGVMMEKFRENGDRKKEKNDTMVELNILQAVK
jgi:hypothetical protein